MSRTTIVPTKGLSDTFLPIILSSGISDPKAIIDKLVDFCLCDCNGRLGGDRNLRIYAHAIDNFRELPSTDVILFYNVEVIRENNYNGMVFYAIEISLNSACVARILLVVENTLDGP